LFSVTLQNPAAPSEGVLATVSIPGHLATSQDFDLPVMVVSPLAVGDEGVLVDANSDAVWFVAAASADVAITEIWTIQDTGQTSRSGRICYYFSSTMDCNSFYEADFTAGNTKGTVCLRDAGTAIGSPVAESAASKALRRAITRRSASLMNISAYAQRDRISSSTEGAIAGKSVKIAEAIRHAREKARTLLQAAPGTIREPTTVGGAGFSSHGLATTATSCPPSPRAADDVGDSIAEAMARLRAQAHARRDDDQDGNRSADDAPTPTRAAKHTGDRQRVSGTKSSRHRRGKSTDAQLRATVSHDSASPEWHGTSADSVTAAENLDTGNPITQARMARQLAAANRLVGPVPPGSAGDHSPAPRSMPVSPLVGVDVRATIEQLRGSAVSRRASSAAAGSPSPSPMASPMIDVSPGNHRQVVSLGRRRMSPATPASTDGAAAEPPSAELQGHRSRRRVALRSPSAGQLSTVAERPTHESVSAWLDKIDEIDEN
jgi:hypothetical protein